jgi:glycosyltransferase involved in cell wall biosynthesis
VIPGESRGTALRGKRAAVLLFSHYPADPRPRRAAEAMASQGMRVEVICLRQRPDEPRRESFKGVDVLRLPVSRRRGGVLAYLVEYCSFLVLAFTILAARSMRHRFDLVHVHNMPDILVFSALFPKILGAKVILDLHDPMPELMTCIFDLPPTSRAVRVMRLFERWSIALADVVLTPNLAFAKLFSARTPYGHKIHIVMNSPDEEIFAYRPFVASERKPDRPFVIMYHGSILERNGPDVAVDAVAAARRVTPHIELRIYGGATPFLHKVMARVRERGLEDIVRYFGAKPLEDIVAAIDECDLGVIPNRQSAFTDNNMPTRIFEYLCRGKAVIAPRTPGIQDYFDDETLLFFKPGDAADLGSAILGAYHDPGAVAGVIQRGQQVYLTRRWNSERDRLVGIVGGLVSKKAAGAAVVRSR